MSAFDRIQNYSARDAHTESSVFNVKTPEGALFQRIHNQGYSLYIRTFSLKDPLSEEEYDALEDGEKLGYDKTVSISEKEYNALDSSEQSKYEEKIEYTELYHVLVTSGNQVINAVAGSGKALANNEEVMGANGYVEIGKLKVGDKVFGSDGNKHEVVGVFPHEGIETYAVNFSNGLCKKCSYDHLWQTNRGILKTSELEKGDFIQHNYYCLSLAEEKPANSQLTAYEYGLLTGLAHTKDLEARRIGLDKLVTGYRGLFQFWLMYDKMLRQGATEIPEWILRGTIANRCEFMDGLLSVSNKFHIDFTLVNDFEMLLDYTGFEYRRTDGDYDVDYEIKRPDGEHNIYVTDVVKMGYSTDMTCIQVDSEDSLFLLRGGIATHNTTALVMKILHDIVTGEVMTSKVVPSGMAVRVVNKVWVCTFLKTGAEELGQALSAWQRRLGYTETASQVTFSTMDAEFKRCLNAMGASTNIAEQSKLNTLFRKAVSICGITQCDGTALANEDYQILYSIVTYYRGRLDESRYRHPSIEDYDLKPSRLDMLVKQFENLRRQEGVMDFEEVMETLYRHLYVTPNKQVQDFVANRYNFIYVDEFQDTSQMAYAILKFYARGHLWMNASGLPKPEELETDGLYTGVETLGKFSVVGDPSQCLLPDSKILLATGETVPVSELKALDRVMCGVGWHDTCVKPAEHVFQKQYKGVVVTLFLEDGTEVSATADHLVPVKYETSVSGSYIKFRHEGDWAYNNGYDSDVLNVSSYEVCDAYYEQDRKFIHMKKPVLLSEFVDMEMFMPIQEIMCGYQVCTYVDGKIEYRTVTSTRSQWYEGFVYDVSIPEVYNFIADGVIMHNCIYTFRGSDSAILVDHVDRDFRPSICALSVNWRCPKNILNPIVPSIHQNPDSAKQMIMSQRDGGEFYAYAFSGYREMLDQLRLDIERDLDDGLSVAILCRTTYDGMIPAFILEADGHFDFGVSSENMTLHNKLPRSLIEVSHLFTERSSAAVKNALSLFVGYNGQHALKQVMDAMKMNNMSIWNIDIQDLKYSCPSLVSIIEATKKIFIKEDGRHKELEMEALQVMYWYLIQNKFKGNSQYSISARACIETLLYIIKTQNFPDVFSFLEEVENIGDRLNGRIKRSKAKVQIATVHEFKGKECDSVYVWNDSDGVFPSRKCNVEDADQVYEERRVHYIACTRARQREHIYSLDGSIGMFAQEMDMSYERPQRKLNVTL